MKLAIAGSRTITDYTFFLKIMSLPVIKGWTELVVGDDPKGVDNLAKHYAREKGVEPVLFEADYSRYGASTGSTVVNRDIAEYADALVAIWDGSTPKTWRRIQAFHEKGKPAYVFVYVKGEAN